MANTILLKRSSVTGKVPTAGGLQFGELSINYTDGVLYYKNNSGTVLNLNSTIPFGTGTVGGIPYLNNANVLVTPSNHIYDSATGNVVIAATTTSSNTATGALVVKGGAGIAGNITSANVFATGVYIGSGSAISGLFWSANNQPVSTGPAGSGIAYTASTTAPVSPNNGDFWYYTTGDILYQYLYDGTNHEWVDVIGSSNTGSSANIANALVARDSVGSFAANIITVNGGFRWAANNNSIAVSDLLGTATTANVSLYEQLTNSTTNATFYLPFFDKATGNAAAYTNTAVNVNPSTGTISALAFAGGTGAFGTTTLSGNITPSANLTINSGGPSNYWGTTWTGRLTANTAVISAGTANAIVATGNVYVAGSMIPFTTNATYNLGTTSSWWGTFYGVSTQAQYADLAEKYTGDALYEPGTVVIFGGEQEVTTTTLSHDTRAAGVVSTNPAYLMNAAQDGIPVALTGRVPCYVQGPVFKGQVLVTGSTVGTAQGIQNGLYQPGCILGKALSNIVHDSVELIEIVVGRF